MSRLALVFCKKSNLQDIAGALFLVTRDFFCASLAKRVLQIITLVIINNQAARHRYPVVSSGIRPHRWPVWVFQTAPLGPMSAPSAPDLTLQDVLDLQVQRFLAMLSRYFGESPLQI